MTKFTTQEPWLFVEVTEPTQEQIVKFYGDNMIPPVNNKDRAIECKIVTIKHSYSREEYPINSKWIMGDAPTRVLNFFGEKIEKIQSNSIYARIDE